MSTKYDFPDDNSPQLSRPDHSTGRERPANLTPSGQSTTSEEPEIVESHSETLPTASHQLAEQAATDAPPEEKGVAQLDHGDVEVTNLGWNGDLAKVPQPLVGGLSNEDVWILVRRFNKHIFHVKSMAEPPLGELDLENAEEVEFSPDKLRAQLERVYMTVVVGALNFWKHIARLRSWNEWHRTLAFLSVYTVAWAINFLLPTIFGFLLVLILYPRSRAYCFPPAPLSLIDTSTGGVKKPAAGVLASDDTVTGAPENHPGEAVEQEAHSFLNSITALAVGSAAGKHPKEFTDAKDQARGDDPISHQDKTKMPVREAVWDKARPVMHGLADFVDTYERFGNALDATPPFPKLKPRLMVASVLAPLFLGSLFLSSHAMVKGTGFAMGFTMFGDPLIQRGIQFIERTYPHWRKYVELRHTILKGVPTNAQLTITLLRIAERSRAPLPPPPGSGDEAPSHEAHETAGDNLEHLNVPQHEIDAAVQPTAEGQAEDAHGGGEQTGGKKRAKILSFIRSTAKGGVHAALGADRIKAAAGAHHAKDRLGVLKQDPIPETGPVRFPARFKGTKGHAYLTATATTPALSWTTEAEDVNPEWTVAIADILEMNKVGGLSFKSKIVVGWATGQELADGLIVKDVEGRELHLTAIMLRDALFNRLVSIGNQMWEAW